MSAPPPKGSRKNTVVLHDELIECCAARASLSTHSAMKIASRTLRTFIHEATVFTTRLKLGVHETSIHVALRSSSATVWFSLQQKALSDHHLLRRVPFPYIPASEYDLIDPGRGRRVYAIAKRTRDFFGVTCGGTYVTTGLPLMQSVHTNPSTAVLGNRLYVFGGCQDTNYIEVLDIGDKILNRQWQTILVDEQDRIIPRSCDVVVKNGKVYFLRKTDCVVFDPIMGRIERKDQESMGERMYRSSCVIDNTLYTIGWNKKIEYFDSYSRSWRVVRGMELPDFDLFSSKLFHFNGDLMVLHLPVPEEIWFTLITLTKQGLKQLRRTMRSR